MFLNLDATEPLAWERVNDGTITLTLGEPVTLHTTGTGSGTGLADTWTSRPITTVTSYARPEPHWEW